MTGYSFPNFDAGYLVDANVLSAPECDTILTALATIRRTRAGARHLMTNPAVAALARDSRFLAIARKVLGGQAIPFRATLFEKTGRANWLVAWHQDTALPLTKNFTDGQWGPWSEKAGIIYAHAPTWALSRVVALRLHLDASTSENGPLRVIPNSHKASVLADTAVFDYVRTHQQIECLIPKGGVLAMSPLLIHCSSKATSTASRRILHIEYADALDLSPGIRLAIA